MTKDVDSSTPASTLAGMRFMARRGAVHTAGPVVFAPRAALPVSGHGTDEQKDDPQADAAPSPAEASAPAQQFKAAPRPGVFSAAAKPATPARGPVLPTLAPVLEQAARAEQQRQERDGVGFFEQVAKQSQRKSGLKEMSSMRSLSRLLEAVYHRPGGDAPIEERIAALQELVGEAGCLAQEMARAFGYAEGSQSQYLMAQAMESVVGLVAQSWERDDAVPWAEMIGQAGVDPLIVGTAEAMAHAIYKPVVPGEAGKQIAHERLAISLHNAYWEIYLLGETCDGITQQVASSVVRSIGEYVLGNAKFSDLDLRVSWLQGSIRRIAGLFCAQMKALDETPTPADIDRAIELAKEGFEGVEFHASQLLDLFSSGGTVSRPLDAPSRPGAG